MVIKVGGSELERPDFLAELGQILAPLERPAIVVHGGGPSTNRLTKKMGLEPQFLDGQRVTDGPTLEIAVLGLNGEASTKLVTGLVAQGVAALGLSGADAALIEVDQVGGDLGLVGYPRKVDAEKLTRLREAGFTPCLSPLSLTADFRLLNVNADFVASAVASGTQADRLVFLTGVGGILVNEQPQQRLSSEQCHQFMQDGTIGAGMIPKVEAALLAKRNGVSQVFITDLKGLRKSLEGQSCTTEVG